MKTNDLAAKTAVFVNAMLIIITLMILGDAPKGYSERYVFGVLMVSGLHFVYHYWVSINGSLSKPTLALDLYFLVGLIAVNFSIPIMLLTDTMTFVSIDWRTPGREYFSKATLVVLLAQFSFSLGFFSIRKKHKELTNISLDPNKSKFYYVRLTQLLFFPGLLLYFYMLINVGSYYLSGSYNDVSGLEEKYDVPFWISQILLTLSFTTIVAGYIHRNTWSGFLGLCVALAYLSLLIILAIHGDRGSVIMLISPLLYLFFWKLNKRYQTIVFISLILIGLVSISVLRTARNMDERGLASIRSAADSVQFSANLTQSASNLGGSGNLLPIALHYVERHGTQEGAFSANSVLGFIPYSRRFLRSIGLIEQDGYSQSAILLTDVVNGKNARSGVGTTSVADLYLDLGLLGVIIGHAVLGWIGKIITLKGALGNFISNYRIIYIFSIGVFAVIARYSATTYVVRIIGYAAVAIFVVNFILKRLHTRRKL